MLVPKRTLLIGGIAVVVVYSMTVEPPSGETAPASGAGTCKMAVTADVLNVRAAPDIASEVVGKFTGGAETLADHAIENGFRKLAPNRWAAEEFLEPLPGHDC